MAVETARNLPLGTICASLSSNPVKPVLDSIDCVNTSLTPSAVFFRFSLIFSKDILSIFLI